MKELNNNKIEKPTKNIPGAFFTLILLTGSSFALKGCIQQDYTTEKCKMCYLGHRNDFGSCTAFPLSENGTIPCMISNLSASVSCSLCSKDYYKKASGCLALTAPNTIPNCFHHIQQESKSGSSSSSNIPTMLCSHCSNGFPNAELTSCLAWSGYTGTSKLENCEVSTRMLKPAEAEQPNESSQPQSSAEPPASSSSEPQGSNQSQQTQQSEEDKQKYEPQCYRCKQGFSYDLTTKSCVTAPIQGCWETNNGKCQSCEAWNGWFSDGVDSNTGGIKCIKEEDHQIDLIVIPEPLTSDVRAPIFNRSENFLNKEQQEDLENGIKIFRELSNGFIVADESLYLKQFLETKKDDKTEEEKKEENKFKQVDFGKDIMPNMTYKQSTGSGRSSSSKEVISYIPGTVRCFFTSSFCLMIYFPYNETTKKQESDRLFIFNGSNPLYNGDIFINEFKRDGKHLALGLPIVGSSYLILAFSTDSKWPLTDTTMLLRIDYLNTERQFGYELPKKARQLSPFYLYYIEYSNFFLAGFSGGNGVVAYDLTKSSTLPAKEFNKETGMKYGSIAYLEGSRILLINAQNSKRIYGYSFFNERKKYHITSNYEVSRLIAIKASDFYAVYSQKLDRRLEFYNLGILVTTLDLGRNTIQDTIYSQSVGQLLIPQSNLIIKLTPSAQTLNPSCKSVGFSKFSFTNKGCSQCSARATMTKKGVCEMSYEPSNVHYISSKISANLPTNTQGEKFELKLREPSPGPPSKFWRVFRIILISMGPALGFVTVYLVALVVVIVLENRKKRKQKQEKDKLEKEKARKKKEEEEKKKKEEEEKKKKEEEEKKDQVFGSKLSPSDKTRFDKLKKEVEEWKAKYNKLLRGLKKKEADIKEREDKLEKEKEALGLIKDEIHDGLPLEKLNQNDSERIPFMNIRVKTRNNFRKRKSGSGVSIKTPSRKRSQVSDFSMFSDV